MLVEKAKVLQTMLSILALYISKEHVKQLKYFDNFKETIDLMTYLINEKDVMYPDNIEKT